MRQTHIHFYPDVEAALRCAEIKTAYMRMMQPYKILIKPLNLVSGSNPNPHFKAQYTFLTNALIESKEGANYWYDRMTEIEQFMRLEYVYRQSCYTSVIRLREGDDVTIFNNIKTLQFPSIFSHRLLLDPKVIYKVRAITKEGIVLRHNVSTYLNVPYSIIKKVDPNIIYYY